MKLVLHIVFSPFSMVKVYLTINIVHMYCAYYRDSTHSFEFLAPSSIKAKVIENHWTMKFVHNYVSSDVFREFFLHKAYGPIVFIRENVVL